LDFKTTGCLKNNQAAGSTTEVRDQGANPFIVIWHAPSFASGANGNVELVLGDVDADPQRCNLNRLLS
jgi:hypothetical protein